MGKTQPLRFRLPDEEGWIELCQSLKLNPSQAAALKGTLSEVDERCRELTAELERAEIKSGLKPLERVLVNAEQQLQRAGVRKAVASVEMHGAISFLVSREAGAEIHGKTVVDQIAHDRLLDEHTADVMLYLLQRMRRPLSSWLKVAAQDKGGHPPKTDRELLLFLLARDAQEIVGVVPTSTPNGPFHNLCTWVFGACNVGTKGLEGAIARCLEKYQHWLNWSRLPSAGHNVGRLSEAEIIAMLRSSSAGAPCRPSSINCATS